MAEPGVYNGEDYDKLREDDPHYREVEEDITRLTGVYAEMSEKVDKTIRTFHTGATRDTDEGKLDWEGFISPEAMFYYAEYMNYNRIQSDGTLRDSDNWKKGFPRRQIVKSLLRHTWDFWRAWIIQQQHPKLNMNDALVEFLCAIFFNVQAMLHEISIGRDVDDR